MSLEALKIFCVMRASVPSLYNVYRRYDTQAASARDCPRRVEVTALNDSLFAVSLS